MKDESYGGGWCCFWGICLQGLGVTRASNPDELLDLTSVRRGVVFCTKIARNVFTVWTVLSLHELIVWAVLVAWITSIVCEWYALYDFRHCVLCMKCPLVHASISWLYELCELYELCSLYDSCEFVRMVWIVRIHALCSLYEISTCTCEYWLYSLCELYELCSLYDSYEVALRM